MARPMIDARDLGFVGDGVADNTAALTRLAADTTSPTVYFPAGTYMISSTTAIEMASSVSMIGAGQGATTLKLTADGSLPSVWMFDWTGRSGFKISGLTIDLNGATRTGLPAAIIRSRSSTDWSVDHVSVINGSTNMALIDGVAGSGGVARYNISDNYLALKAPSTSGNWGIMLSDAGGGGITGGKVLRNNLVNTAIFADVNHTTFDGNTITGWGYGGGITLAANASNSHDNKVTANYIHDSQTTTDVDITAACGIENWSRSSTLASNHIDHVGADGIANMGANSTISDNWIYAAGKRADIHQGNGITGGYYDATYNSDNSRYVGNRAFDDAAEISAMDMPTKMPASRMSSW